jgi:mRNA interferase RelE/StbE
VESKKFTVKLNVESSKAFSELGKHDKSQISKKLLQLEDNPYKDAKKLKGREYWRVKVGDFRIIYTIDKGILLVLVIKIGPRKDIYKHL